MKKNILSLIVILSVLSFVVAGCGSDGKLVMGTNAEFPPFEYVEGNEVVGFDVEISKLVAEAMGSELAIENMGFDSLIPALQAGKVDFVAAGMTVTDERMEMVDFSDSYFISTQVIIVNNENNTVASPADLEGKKIGVQISTTGEMLAKSIEGTEVSSYNAGYAAVMDLVNGKVDAVILDQEPAVQLVANNDSTTILDEALSHEEYAIAVPKGQEELLQKINETLAKIKEDGTYDQLFSQYFTEATAE